MQQRAGKNQVRAIGNQPSQRKRGSEGTLRFAANRPEAKQNERLQGMANEGPQAQKAAQLQAMINNSSYMKALSDRTDRMSGSAVQRQEAPEDEELQLKARSGPVQRQDEPEEEEPLQGKLTTKMAPAQRQGELEEEEPLQGAFEPAQRQALEEEDVTQGKAVANQAPAQPQGALEQHGNNTGLPSKLKAGVENLSGESLNDVRVHYNSSKPASLQALAYTQRTDIHVGPGHERHLPHEAWHVAQQKQGRVKPTMQMGGVGINNDRGLEREADVMGARAQKWSSPQGTGAIEMGASPRVASIFAQRKASSSSAIQRMVGINSGNVHSEIRGLIADPYNIPKMTEAYTYLQHIDWAHNIVGGRVFDMGSPAFQSLSGSENLILVAHGLEGVSGHYNGAEIADHLAASGTGVPDGWRGGVYITSCYSGAGVDSVVKDVAGRLQALGKTGISVTGYTGTTITHKQFQEFLFVVNPAKETEMKAISDRVALKYKSLFGEWYVRMQGLTTGNILEMAAYTSDLTATAYAEIVREGSEKGYFLGPEDAEVTRTS